MTSQNAPGSTIGALGGGLLPPKCRFWHFSDKLLGERGQEYGAGAISFAEVDASVQGWINHVCYADTWGLRQHVLDTPLHRPEQSPNTRI